MPISSFVIALFIYIVSLLIPNIAQSMRNRPDLTELSIEDLMQFTVYSASKFEQKTAEAPSSVSIITASEIEKYGYRTLADILRSVRSLYVTYDRKYSFLGIRGFSRPGDYNSRVLLLVDGVRANDAIYNTAAIGTDFILDVDLIDRVEIIRGTGSSLYGSNAFFAVINHHVGFYVGMRDDGRIDLLGGNQSNSVNITPYSTAEVLGYRWPV